MRLLLKLIIEVSIITHTVKNPTRIIGSEGENSRGGGVNFKNVPKNVPPTLMVAFLSQNPPLTLSFYYFFF